MPTYEFFSTSSNGHDGYNYYVDYRRPVGNNFYFRNKVGTDVFEYRNEDKDFWQTCNHKSLKQLYNTHPTLDYSNPFNANLVYPGNLTEESKLYHKSIGYSNVPLDKPNPNPNPNPVMPEAKKENPLFKRFIIVEIVVAVIAVVGYGFYSVVQALEKSVQENQVLHQASEIDGEDYNRVAKSASRYPDFAKKAHEMMADDKITYAEYDQLVEVFNQQTKKQLKDFHD